VEGRSKDKHIHKNNMIIYKNSYVEHVYNSGTAVWKRERGKGKQNDNIY
jgi:hypothetical protein